MNHPDNAPHNALTDAINRAIANGAPVYENKAWTVPVVYVAAYWHRDNDPIGGVVGFDKATVENQVQQCMMDEYANIVTDCDCPECEHEELCDADEDCECDCCEDTLRWGGEAFPVSLLEFMRDCPKWARQETLDGLRTDGWTYEPML